MINDTNRHVM